MLQIKHDLMAQTVARQIFCKTQIPTLLHGKIYIKDKALNDT